MSNIPEFSIKYRQWRDEGRNGAPPDNRNKQFVWRGRQQRAANGTAVQRPRQQQQPTDDNADIMPQTHESPTPSSQAEMKSPSLTEMREGGCVTIVPSLESLNADVNDEVADKEKMMWAVNSLYDKAMKLVDDQKEHSPGPFRGFSQDASSPQYTSDTMDEQPPIGKHPKHNISSSSNLQSNSFLSGEEESISGKERFWERDMSGDHSQSSDHSSDDSRYHKAYSTTSTPQVNMNQSPSSFQGSEPPSSQRKKKQYVDHESAPNAKRSKNRAMRIHKSKSSDEIIEGPARVRLGYVLASPKNWGWVKSMIQKKLPDAQLSLLQQSTLSRHGKKNHPEFTWFWIIQRRPNVRGQQTSSTKVIDIESINHFLENHHDVREKLMKRKILPLSANWNTNKKQYNPQWGMLAAAHCALNFGGAVMVCSGATKKNEAEYMDVIGSKKFPNVSLHGMTEKQKSYKELFSEFCHGHSLRDLVTNYRLSFAVGRVQDGVLKYLTTEFSIADSNNVQSPSASSPFSGRGSQERKKGGYKSPEYSSASSSRAFPPGDEDLRRENEYLRELISALWKQNSQLRAQEQIIQKVDKNMDLIRQNTILLQSVGMGTGDEAKEVDYDVTDDESGMVDTTIRVRNPEEDDWEEAGEVKPKGKTLGGLRYGNDFSSEEDRGNLQLKKD